MLKRVAVLALALLGACSRTVDHRGTPVRKVAHVEASTYTPSQDLSGVSFSRKGMRYHSAWTAARHDVVLVIDGVKHTFNSEQLWKVCPAGADLPVTLTPIIAEHYAHKGDAKPDRTYTRDDWDAEIAGVHFWVRR